jgi:LytR cell envelope-related transcriptional attenuator
MVQLFAFSLQDQAETYGAYVGLAAFLGLAVLSLLFFAQARELKRLRDWAGRAPERAQEIEARAIAQAEEALRQTPATVGPAQPVPKPAVAAASDNGRKQGTPAPIPMGPRPATAAAALAASGAGQATAAWAGPATAPPEEEAATQIAAPEPVEAASDDGSAAAVPAEPDEATTGPDETTPADEAPEATPVEDEAEEAAEEEPAAEPATPFGTHGGTFAKPAEPGKTDNGVPAVAPPIGIPRATPRPPRPAPAQPLRASGARSTTLPPPRRGQVAAGRGEGSSPAKFAIVAVVGVLVLAGGAFGITRLLAEEDEPAPPPNRPTDSSEQGGAASAGAGERAAAARPEKVVAVLNGTPIVGLASQTRDKLVAEGYSDEQGMIRTGNNTDQQRQDSVVLFRSSGERRQARDVAAILDIDTIELIDDETQALADGTDETNSGVASDVVVVVGADQAP